MLFSEDDFHNLSPATVPEMQRYVIGRECDEGAALHVTVGVSFD
jgi:hypothetical protein